MCYTQLTFDTKLTEFGSVSMESIMDTTTRVFSSVAVLGAVFGLLLDTYKGIGANMSTLQASGDIAIQKTVDYIDRGRP